MIKVKPTPFNLTWMLLLAAAIIVGSPILLIWALNTLFPVLAIPTTFETWLAAFLIPTVLKFSVKVNE